MMQQIQELSFETSVQTISLGSSLTIGLLSFSGMFALYPSPLLACISAILAVAYEGEIFTQNTRSALNKLLANESIEQQIVKEYLCKQPVQATHPLFLHDYLVLLKYQHSQEHDPKCSPEDKALIKESLSIIERRVMDIWLQNKEINTSLTYNTQIESWLEENNLRDQNLNTLAYNRSFILFFTKMFSALSGLCAGIGTMYLLAEAFTLVPILSAIAVPLWPLFIIPMSTMAGFSQSMSTYNALTDMIISNLWGELWGKICANTQSFPRTIAMIGIFSICIALTICNIGTWSTILNESNIPSILEWMLFIPVELITSIAPLTMGISAFIFNIQNTLQSMELIELWIENSSNLSQIIHNKMIDLWWLYQTENIVQFINPFRILHNLVSEVLTYGLFIGHLISIGVTADRLPIPNILSAYSKSIEFFSKWIGRGVGVASELLEDLHYIFNEDKHPTQPEDLLRQHLSNETAHSHDKTLPHYLIFTLTMLTTYPLALVWDQVFGFFNQYIQNNRYELCCDANSRSNDSIFLQVKEGTVKYNAGNLIDQEIKDLSPVEIEQISTAQSNQLPEELQKKIFAQTYKHGLFPKLRETTEYTQKQETTSANKKSVDSIIKSLNIHSNNNAANGSGDTNTACACHPQTYCGTVTPSRQRTG